ncbi:hypothetical protein AX15_005075 [Amanita polypyramis BW_CC]|nr:hypothetical protein AX15_005075 [Amanita polypyramis BW_CC]
MLDGASDGTGADVYYNALVAGLRHGQFYKYVNVATLTVFVVDYIATLDFELEYMWPLKWNLVSVLFLLTRYLPALDMAVTLYTQHAINITQPLCSALATTYVWLIYAGMAVAEGLLILRVWALSGRGRKLSVFLLAVYIGSFAASAIKIYLSLKTVQVSVVMIPLPGNPVVCYTKSYDQQLYLYWVCMIIVDAVSCVLLLMQLVNAFKIGGLTNLMRVVYRDGVIFYIVLLCFSVVNIFAIVVLTADISSLLTAPERIIHAVLAGRVVLQTRHQVHEDKQISLNTIPSINAAHPEQFSHASTRISFAGNYTSPGVSPSVSVTIPKQVWFDLHGSTSMASPASPVSLNISPMSISTPVYVHSIRFGSQTSSSFPVSPTSPTPTPNPQTDWNSSPSASVSRNTSTSSSDSDASSVPRSNMSGTGTTSVTDDSARSTGLGGPGPVFEAAMRRQRQRQYARIRRSLRMCAHRYVAVAAPAGQRQYYQYHLPSRKLTGSPYPEGEADGGAGGGVA